MLGLPRPSLTACALPRRATTSSSEEPARMPSGVAYHGSLVPIVTTFRSPSFTTATRPSPKSLTNPLPSRELSLGEPAALTSCLAGMPTATLPILCPGTIRLSLRPVGGGGSSAGRLEPHAASPTASAAARWILTFIVSPLQFLQTIQQL